jgi:predicted P-loop ATPase/GTPase
MKNQRLILIVEQNHIKKYRKMVVEVICSLDGKKKKMVKESYKNLGVPSYKFAAIPSY